MFLFVDDTPALSWYFRNSRKHTFDFFSSGRQARRIWVAAFCCFSFASGLGGGARIACFYYLRGLHWAFRSYCIGTTNYGLLLGTVLPFIVSNAAFIARLSYIYTSPKHSSLATLYLFSRHLPLELCEGTLAVPGGSKVVLVTCISPKQD